MQGSVRVEIEKEELILLPTGAVFWPAQDALLVSDLHVGKGASFRSKSVPIPSGSSEDTLLRLSSILSETGVRTLYMLGDFWHSRQGRTEHIDTLVCDWRERHRVVEMTLIEGNHDRRSGALPLELGIETLSEAVLGPFVLKHHPEEDERGYVLCGHIHPAVRLVRHGRQVTRLAAFWFGERVGVLPAFGGFTGAATVYPGDRDRVFVIAEESVVLVGLTGVGSS